MPNDIKETLELLSVVIPARDEEGCIAGTIEHLHLELELHNIPHEIVVADDGSTDRTWPILQDLARKYPSLNAIQNTGRMDSVKRLSPASMRHTATLWSS
jgi:dolichol-phosphate mannosyltransferase